MRLIGISLVSSILAIVAVAAQPLPAPPVKAGLWEAKSSALDAEGKETVPPEQAALAKMPPEMRAKMAEVMKGRGLSMPDANGAVRVCLTKEMFDSGSWQQVGANTGCTTTFSTRTSSTWKWHSSCKSLNSESDGETVFASPESYRTKMTTTATVQGKTNTTTRIVQAKWVGADCGDVKPITPASLGR